MKQWIAVLILGFLEEDQERGKETKKEPRIDRRRRCRNEDAGMIFLESADGGQKMSKWYSGSRSRHFRGDVMAMILKEDISNLKLKRRLGQGGSDNADVFLSTWHHNSNVQDVAQKMFIVRSIGNGSFRNEVSIMAK